ACRFRSRRFPASSHPTKPDPAPHTAPARARSRHPVRREPDSPPATRSRAGTRYSHACRQRRGSNVDPLLASYLSLPCVLQNVPNGLHVEVLREPLNLPIDRMTVRIITCGQFRARDEFLDITAHCEIVQLCSPFTIHLAGELRRSHGCPLHL